MQNNSTEHERCWNWRPTAQNSIGKISIQVLTADLMAPGLTELISSVVISTVDKNQLPNLIN